MLGGDVVWCGVEIGVIVVLVDRSALNAMSSVQFSSVQCGTKAIHTLTSYSMPIFDNKIKISSLNLIF